MPTPNKGFTLIELMVVLAVVGIVMAMGVPAYQNYLKNARVATVDANYKNAIRVVRNEMYKRQLVDARGGTQEPTVFRRRNIFENVLNPDKTIKAGDGVSLAYNNTADSDTGVIGIVTPTGGAVDGNLSVNIILPQYEGGASAGGLDGDSTLIRQIDL